MDLTAVLALLISGFSLAVVLVGLPAQVVKNKKEKRSGHALVTLLIMLGFYLVQMAYFAVTKTYAPLISFTVGFIMWAILLYQWAIYGKENK